MRPDWRSYLTPEELAKCLLLDIEIHVDYEYSAEGETVFAFVPVKTISPQGNRLNKTRWLLLRIPNYKDGLRGRYLCNHFKTPAEAIDGVIHAEELGYTWK